MSEETPKDAPKEKPVLYALGGIGGSGTMKSVSLFNPRTGYWTAASTEIPSPRTNFACVTIERRIYVIGGSNGWRDTNTMLVLSTGSDYWEELPPMAYHRQGCGAAVSADRKYIYVAGGWDGERAWSIVERYSIDDRKWTRVKSMGVARRGLQLIELGGYLYALGGCCYRKYKDIEGGKYCRCATSSAERYDPQTDQWSPIARMNHNYTNFGATVLDGKIYVLGGNGFEVYSPENDLWTALPVPPTWFPNRRLVAMERELIAIGGNVWDGEKWVACTSVASFNVDKQKWNKKKNMAIGTINSCVVVVNHC